MEFGGIHSLLKGGIHSVLKARLLGSSLKNVLFFSNTLRDIELGDFSVMTKKDVEYHIVNVIKIALTR